MTSEFNKAYVIEKFQYKSHDIFFILSQATSTGLSM
jgi:hypothetical protein